VKVAVEQFGSLPVKDSEEINLPHPGEPCWTFLPQIVDLLQISISIIRTGIHFWVRK
jgi:hypothetical protein